MNANRMVVGTLRGFDQFMNLVVDNTVEVNGNEKTDIGMVVGPLALPFFFFFLVVSFIIKLLNCHWSFDNVVTILFPFI